MNKFTLSFKEQEYELNYRKSQLQSDVIIFERNFYFVILFLILTIIQHLLSGNLINAILLTITTTCFVVTKLAGKNSANLFDILIFIAQIAYNLNSPIGMYLDSNFSNQDSFNRGQGVAFASFSQIIQNFLIIQSFLLGTQFCFKGLICLCNCFLQLTLLWMKDRDYDSFRRYFFVVYTFLVINYIYIAEKEKRHRYLLETQKGQFDSIVQSQINIGVAKCKFINLKNNSELSNFNQYMTDKFQVTDDITFKQFIRRTYIKNNKETSSCLLKKSKNLEQFLYQIFIRHQSGQIKLENGKTLYDFQFRLEGRFDDHSYQLKLQLFYDYEPFILIIIEDLHDGSSYKKIQYQLELSQKILHQLIQKLSLFVRNSIITLKQYDFASKQLKQNHLNQLISNLKFWGYLEQQQIMNYELYLYQLPYIISLNQFNLNNIFFQIISILKPLIKFKEVNLFLKKKFLPMHSNLQLTQQLLLNILFNALQYCKKKTLLRIEISEEIDPITSDKLIQIIINEQGKPFKGSSFTQLPIINPSSTNSFEFMKNVSKLQLGLAVSCMILKKIGPCDEIFITQNSLSKQIRFTLFQDLRNILQIKSQTKSTDEKVQKKIKLTYYDPKNQKT